MSITAAVEEKSGQKDRRITQQAHQNVYHPDRFLIEAPLCHE